MKTPGQMFKKRSQSGVALIFFTMVFGLFLGFFMIVINSGFMVWQKVRLQTATAMAAYTAASVAAAYLGNYENTENSVQGKNQKIMNEYFDLLETLKTRPNRVAFPGIWPDPGSCSVACNAMNVAVAGKALNAYDDSKERIMRHHTEIRRILQQLPAAMQKAAEATVRANVPDLTIGQGAFAASGDTTNQANEILNANLSSIGQKRKNAVLSFSSAKGAYLANVVVGVPHTLIYFGPMCVNACPDPSKCPPLYYCPTNGAGTSGGFAGLAQSLAAYALGREGVGNIGKIERMSKLSATAMPLHFVENPHKPRPFVVVAADWFPENGTFMNLENSLGAKGSLFPKRTRLVAVSAAEPFGGSLAKAEYLPFGTRLAGIRKLLLDPRVSTVKQDYGDLWKYMQSLGPKGPNQQPETAEETIKRFLH
jgi:hypothetical protein